jgi:hypothetical protein
MFFTFAFHPHLNLLDLLAQFLEKMLIFLRAQRQQLIGAFSLSAPLLEFLNRRLIISLLNFEFRIGLL